MEEHKLVISETAGLLPAHFFENRYKVDYEVRENLFEHQLDKQSGSEWTSTNEIEDGYQADQPYAANQLHKVFQIQPDE